MNRRRFLSAAAVAPGTVLAQPALIKGSDERLKVMVRVSETMIPLHRVLGRIHEQTGVLLTADRKIRHETVFLFARDRTAEEILTHLASALKYSWRPMAGGGGWELHQSRAAAIAEKQTEEKARLVQIQPLVDWMCEIASAAERAPRLPADAGPPMQASHPELEDTSGQSNHRLRVQERERQLLQDAGGQALLALRVFRSLPQNLQRQALLGERIICPGFARGLDRDALMALAQSRAITSTANDRRLDPQSLLHALAEPLALRTWMGVGWARLMVATDPMQGASIGTYFHLRASSRLDLEPNWRWLRGGRVTLARDSSEIVALPEAGAGRVRAEDPVTYFEPLSLFRLAAAAAASQPGLAFAGRAESRQIYPGFPGPIAPRLEDTQAEDYVPPDELALLKHKVAPAGGMPLREWLDLVARGCECEMQVTGDGWIEARSCYARNHRDGCVDPAQLAPLFQPAIRRGVYLADDAIPVSAALTPAQLAHLGDERTAFLRRLLQTWTLDGYPGWWILAACSPGVRRRLERGERIPYIQLTTAVKKAVDRSISYLRRTETRPGARALPALSRCWLFLAGVSPQGDTLLRLAPSLKGPYALDEILWVPWPAGTLPPGRMNLPPPD